MVQRSSFKPTIAAIENCLHDALSVCNKLRDQLGHSYHQEAADAIISPYEGRDDYERIQRLSNAMVREYSNTPALVAKIQNTPDLQARQKAFLTLAAVSLEADDNWNPFHEKRLTTRLAALAESVKDTLQDSAAFTQFLDTIPKALSQYRTELDQTIADEVFILAHPDVVAQKDRIDGALDTAAKHRKARKTPNKDGGKGK